MHGIKALRECDNAVIKECDIVSPEFGWFTDGVRMTDSTAVGEYFMMRAKNIAARRLDFKGKYSFQYVEGVIITDSKLDTKDAFLAQQKRNGGKLRRNRRVFGLVQQKPHVQKLHYNRHSTALLLQKFAAHRLRHAKNRPVVRAVGSVRDFAREHRQH